MQLASVLTPLLVAVMVAAVALPAGAAHAAKTAASPLAKVRLVGAVGVVPTLKFAKPFAMKTSAHVVATAGTGAPLAKGQNVTFDYLIVDARDGKQIESSFGKTPGRLSLDATKTAKPLITSLVGAPVGSRVLIGIAPKDGLAKTLKSAGVKKNDTLLFVLDVKAATSPLTRATGAAVAPVAGLPTVTVDPATGKPTIAKPSGAAPTTLVVETLIKGSGPVVASGQTVTVHYTGVIWASGKQFDSSWDRGATFDTQIGTGHVIAGWDEGLVGQTVGSQVLLAIPPDKGYGASGQSSAGISGTDTLVFVVDILDAA
jgi:FKBP-type peptidyl-prolyl cis-trans isomerase